MSSDSVYNSSCFRTEISKIIQPSSTASAAQTHTACFLNDLKFTCNTPVKSQIPHGNRCPCSGGEWWAPTSPQPLFPSPQGREGPWSCPSWMLAGLGLSVFSGVFLRTVGFICHLLVANLINSTVIPASAPSFPSQATQASVISSGGGKGRSGEALSLG